MNRTVRSWRANRSNCRKAPSYWLALLLSSAPLIFQSSLAAQGNKPATPRRAAQSSRKPGPLRDAYLLPNGWRLTPAGSHTKLGDFPMNLAMSPDGRHLAVTNNGAGPQSLQIVETAGGKLTQTITLGKAWLGLAFSPDGKRLYVSAGADNKVLVYSFSEGKAEPAGEIALGGPADGIFAAGLAVSPDGKKVFVACNLQNKVAIIDAETRQVTARVDVKDHPYTCLASRDGKSVFVSNWGSASVSVMDAASSFVLSTIDVGEHPNDLALSPDGNRLFVACANSNRVDVIDLAKGKVVEGVSMSLTPKAPVGSTTNGVAVSPDGKRLFVVNADNNDAAIVDISKPGASRVMGFIPTGWYPTAVKTSLDGRRLFIASGKGLESMANAANGPDPYKGRTAGYIGSLLAGALSIVDVPGPSQLARYSKQVYSNTPYITRAAINGEREPTAIPRRPGQPSPIKHVIYIIKENRTYDQVFGDIKEGNGDPNICLFGEEITPNLHALARQFVLLDNFYADAEVSADGHNWSMAAYATDYVEKTWPTLYSDRGRTYDYEGQKEISSPPLGYIWDHCKRRGVSYRSYGEFTREPSGSNPRRANVKALEDHFAPNYPGWNLSIKDQARADEWLKEFREYEKNGGLPRFQIVRMGNDHTSYMKPGVPTPKAMVADNDYAVGRLVDAVSHSAYWRDTAIFIVEDDAQNGPDHVDAHRTEALVISSYTKRGYTDSTMYSTSSMLRTMELILGLRPMSQYDAGAAPMFNSFTARADLAAFSALEPRVDLNELNPGDSRDAKASLAANLDEADFVPDVEFNEILWRAMKGDKIPMPPPIRSAFVRPIEDR